jgi:RNA-binding protein YlmH
MSFIDHIEHIKTKQQPTVLRFCTLTEQAQIQNRIPSVMFDGGYPDAEKKRAFLFLEPYPAVICFQMHYDKRYLTITHQNILGTLMSLSITSDSIGDILPDQDVFFVTAEIADEIERSFTAINRVPIQLESIDSSTIIRNQQYSYDERVVASLRLDLVVSKIAKISREEAQMRIQNEWVKINHVVQTKPTKTVSKNDILSIRKSGRYVIDDTEKKTKKNNIVLPFRKYE